MIVEAARHFHVGTGHLVVGGVSAAIAVACAFVHFEALSFGSRRLARLPIQRRTRVLALMLGLILAHVVEVWIFALAYWGLDHFPSLGHLSGPFEEGALDFVYFSAVSFTTLGFGDLLPVGPIRILCGTEAIVGLSLVTWSASLAFLEMQRDWAEFRRPDLPAPPSPGDPPLG